MPCSDNGERNWYESQEKEKETMLQRRISQANAIEHGKVTDFLCTMCKLVPVDEWKDIYHESSNQTLIDWYKNHLIDDLKYSTTPDRLKVFLQEMGRIACFTE